MDQKPLHGPLVERIWLGEYDRVTMDQRLIHPGDRIMVTQEQADDHPHLFGPLPKAKAEPAPIAGFTPKAKA